MVVRDNPERVYRGSARTKDNGKSVHHGGVPSLGDDNPKDDGPRMDRHETRRVLDDVVTFGRFKVIWVGAGRVNAQDPDGGFRWTFHTPQEWSRTKESLIQVYGHPRRKQNAEILAG